MRVCAASKRADADTEIHAGDLCGEVSKTTTDRESVFDVAPDGEGAAVRGNVECPNIS